jgi:hypothetical protein
MTNPLPSQARLKELLDYDPLTGGLVWRVRRANKAAGSSAGGEQKSGYTTICIDYKHFYAHRLIWVWQTGEDPGDLQVDHKDRNRRNNCWVNLRLASHGDNCSNTLRQNKTGLPRGVFRNKKRFMSQISKHGKLTHLGTFDTPEEAHQAYSEAAARLHGEFACQV